jgi:hypothetical protein
MPRKVQLPDWATVRGPGFIETQADEFYPEILGEIGVDEKDYDQYWLTVAKCIAKFEVLIGVAGTDVAAPPKGALRIHIKDGTKADNGGVSLWARARFPEGKGAVAGAKDAREIYRQLRGFAPV